MEKVVDKKRVIILIISLILIYGMTFVGGLCNSIEIIGLQILFKVLVNLTNGGIALSAMKLTNMKVDLDIKNKKQYIIGFFIAVLLAGLILLTPFVGPHMEFSYFTIIYKFLYFILIIGPVEELIFRVYLQETCIGFFNKNKWIGVIISSLIFGLWHLINGTYIQVLYAFGIGLIFGFSKYLIKDCKYLGLALGHGLYDFFNTLIQIFIV